MKFCENCGKELQEGQAVCLNCGKLIEDNSNQYNQSNTTTNSMATTGFILAIISLFIYVGGLVAIVATILSATGLGQINSKSENGKGLAIAGLSIGIVSIIWGLYVTLLI